MNAVEGLWRPEGVNILKGRVRVEGMERSHMAAENIGEQWRMLRMKFYITMFYTYKLSDKCDSHILQYHLECIALEQAPTKWIYNASEASGPSLFPF